MSSEAPYTDRFFTFYKAWWSFVYLTMLLGIFALFVLVKVQLMGAEVMISDPAEMYEQRHANR